MCRVETRESVLMQEKKMMETYKKKQIWRKELKQETTRREYEKNKKKDEGLE